MCLKNSHKVVFSLVVVVVVLIGSVAAQAEEMIPLEVSQWINRYHRCHLLQEQIDDLTRRMKGARCPTGPQFEGMTGCGGAHYMPQIMKRKNEHAELSCNKLDADSQQLRTKYNNNAEILRRLDRTEGSP